MKYIAHFLVLLFFADTIFAYDKSEISLGSGIDISYTSFVDNNQTLIIWIPSERGQRPETNESLSNIHNAGFDIWSLDLHDSYLIPPGKSSIDEFDPNDIYALMQKAKQRGYKHIVLSSANRGAVLALKTGRKWQLQHPVDHNFIGFIFLHPHLLDGAVEMGKEAKYLPITRAVNKPVFILQPEFTTKFLRSNEVIRELASGGATVKLKELAGTVGGFHARDKADLTMTDLAMRSKMGAIYKQAVKFLTSSKQPESAAKLKISKPKSYKPQVASLYPYKGNPLAPELKLKDIYNKEFDLQDYKNQVVLINFWASWCGPCIEEIPSLNRLAAKMQGKNFQLLTIDIKETKSRIQDFFNKLELEHNFPILMDTDGATAKAWKVYAYPSNFLLDKDGKIRFAYRGALKWDEPNIIKTIESLL